MIICFDSQTNLFNVVARSDLIAKMQLSVSLKAHLASHKIVIIINHGVQLMKVNYSCQASPVIVLPVDVSILCLE